MGLNPFKAAKKAVKGVTKPLKKVLRSPIGKAALMYATWKFGPKAFGSENLGGAGGWGQAATKLPPWLYEAGAQPIQQPTGILAKPLAFAKKHPYITAGAAAMGAGAMAEPELLEESTTVVDDSGHRGYLNARKGFVDEWTQWLVDQGHDEDTARAMAEKELFAKAEGGVVGLAQGGRIGLYGGGMGAMNNSMNPMMNQGLGAMGSPGMNPYNQQNLMAQGQMRAQPGGQPGGRPPMPGGPTTAQGPGLASLQSAKLPEQNEDNELLKLIRMLASLGIPMEQLRGRTKEELVEMVIAVQSRTQPEGRPEVVEESEEVEEEVMTAAGGGRVHAAGGLGETRGNPAVVGEIEDAREFMISNQGIEDVADYAGEYEQEEEEVVIPRAGGGLMRTGYAMGSEQPIIPSRDGPQIDYRGIGGYQPHGAKEKKDDVRALLAQGEFVVTSDAVKGIGEGDRDLGAKRMYDMMHKYEPIGRALS